MQQVVERNPWKWPHGVWIIYQFNKNQWWWVLY